MRTINSLWKNSNNKQEQEQENGDQIKSKIVNKKVDRKYVRKNSNNKKSICSIIDIPKTLLFKIGDIVDLYDWNEYKDLARKINTLNKSSNIKENVDLSKILL